ncbi:MAG: S9 family peptidase [Liquorilactobacillus nagelii]|uniref:S9 family peptidase n=1 Tax=Liquorilactobacillus nagelii TaxID=82688 RepID=UPI0039E9C5AF
MVTNEERLILAAESLNIQPLWENTESGFYFMSDRSGIWQVYHYSFINKKTVKITNASTGVLDFILHPNNNKILYLTRPETVLPNAPFITKRAYYKFNGHGLIRDNNHLRKLWIQSLDDKQKRCLVTTNQGFGSRKTFGLSLDGRKIVFENKVAKNDDFDFTEDLCELSLNDNIEKIEKKSITQEFAAKGSFSDPCFSNDGCYLAFLGNQNAYKNANETKLFVYDLKKHKKIIFNDDNEDFQAGDSCVTDFHQNNTNPLVQWNEAAQCFNFVVSSEGKVCLYEAKPTEKKFKKMFDYNEHIQDFTINPKTGDLALVISRPDLPTSLVIQNFHSNVRKKLNITLCEKDKKYRFANYQSFEFKSHDGGRIPCFLVLPPFLPTEKKIPMILDIHGGPHAMHGFTFHHEVQTFAAKGMAVLLVNPRGSFGYGQKHADGVVGKYGEGDYQDLMTAMDEIIKKFPIIDTEKLFVTGGSYGGFMTNWIITKTNRFKRAATQRSISNFVSMSGTSDIGYWFNTSEAGGADILHPQKLWAESPLSNVGKVRTPTLVLHSDQDLRCPIEQGEQWFIALKALGVKAKFIRFFGESHELSRSGKPSNRVERLKEIVNCFSQEDYFD